MSNMSYVFSIEGPSCANQCTNNNVTNECKAENSCLCKDPQWSTTYACCVQKACNEADFETSIQNWKNICLMEVVPPVTASISSCLPTATPKSLILQTPLPQGQPTPTAISDPSTATGLTTAMKYEIGIGAGVGVPVLVALVMMLVVCVRMCRRRRRRPRKLTAYNLDQVYGMSAENLREPSYFDNERVIPTTMYASRSKSTPLSPPAMEVPLVFSRDPRKVVETPSPLKTPPVFEAFHPSKRTSPVARTTKFDAPILEQSYPSTLRRPDSGSSCYSEKGPYEMSP